MAPTFLPFQSATVAMLADLLLYQKKNGSLYVCATDLIGTLAARAVQAPITMVSAANRAKALLFTALDLLLVGTPTSMARIRCLSPACGGLPPMARPTALRPPRVDTRRCRWRRSPGTPARILVR